MRDRENFSLSYKNKSTPERNFSRHEMLKKKKKFRSLADEILGVGLSTNCPESVILDQRPSWPRPGWSQAHNGNETSAIDKPTISHGQWLAITDTRPPMGRFISSMKRRECKESKGKSHIDGGNVGPELARVLLEQLGGLVGERESPPMVGQPGPPLPKGTELGSYWWKRGCPPMVGQPGLPLPQGTEVGSYWWEREKGSLPWWDSLVYPSHSRLPSKRALSPFLPQTSSFRGVKAPLCLPLYVFLSSIFLFFLLISV